MSVERVFRCGECRDVFEDARRALVCCRDDLADLLD